MKIDLSKLSITTAHEHLTRGDFSARELAEGYLSVIEKKNPEINAYLEVFDDVLDQAHEADKRIADKKEVGLLTGIPLAVKDNILIKGYRCGAASKILEGYHAPYDSTVIQKLKAQGAVFLGRTNMDEFAMGSSTENSAYGPTKNPHDTSRVPGGSSGGSAAAVAAHMALAALGSDTGGSIRQPAAHCGLVGFKPTYGAVSRFGLIAMGSSLDQIGPLTKSISDAKILYDVIRGYDKNDSTSLPETAPTPAKTPRMIGVPRAFLKSGIDEDVLATFEATLKKLESAGFEIRDIEMPSLPYGLAVYYVIMPAEVSTNLARLDGIRYGLSVPADTIGEVYSKTRAAGFGPETCRRILVGTFVLSSGYADAYYRKARAVRSGITQEFSRAFEGVDAIAVPTTPAPAFVMGEKANDPLAMYAEDIFSVPVNLAGVPAISVPAGMVERDGKQLPVGFQIIGPWGGEEVLFKIAEDVEKLRPAP